MKTIKYLCCGIALLALTACGGTGTGGSNDKNTVSLEIKPELSSLGDFFTIEAPTATVTLTETSERGETYVKIMSTISVTVNEDVASNAGFDLDAEILDKNLNKISDFPEFDIEAQNDFDNGTYNDYLKKGTVRATAEWSTTKAKWDNNADEREMWEKIQKDGAFIVIKPGWSSAKFIPYQSGSGKKATEEDFKAETIMVETDSIAF